MRIISNADLHNPPGHNPIADADIHRDAPAPADTKPATPSKPSAPSQEHRERIAKTLRDLDQWRARRGEKGATWKSRKTGRTHTVGDRVSVNGHTGTITHKHEASGLPVIKWDK